MNDLPQRLCAEIGELAEATVAVYRGFDRVSRVNAAGVEEALSGRVGRVVRVQPWGAPDARITGGADRDRLLAHVGARVDALVDASSAPRVEAVRMAALLGVPLIAQPARASQR